uniref:Putative leucine-rich repeat receptor-like serine/threonine-protein kinase At2g24130 n=2 Tax=Zeugodacus cucurbitae TaxID=28588 RepID=A0A0A1WEH8_ZEUCU
MDSEMILDFSDYSTAYERILNKWTEYSNANPNDFADLYGPFSKQLCERYRTTMSSVMSFWDLNDGCLYKILKYACKHVILDSFELLEENHWSMTCPQFKEFYDQMWLKDKLQKIATTKIILLNDHKKILHEIIQRNINIVEVRGERLTNSDLSAIDLFPAIKRLALRNCRLTGKYINELTDLEELDLEDIEGLLPKNLSLIFKNNELRVLKLLRVPGAFTEHLAYEISQNLLKQEGEDVQQLEELALSSDEIEGCQALGCLRYLRNLKIYIKDDWSTKFEFQKCVHFFNALSNNINLKELHILYGILTQDDFEILAMLRNLKKLYIFSTDKIHLIDFCRFFHLTELHISFTAVDMEEFMEILRGYPQLTAFTLYTIFDLTDDKFSEAIEIIKKQNRDKLPVTVIVYDYDGLSEFVRKHTDFLAFEDDRLAFSIVSSLEYVL